MDEKMMINSDNRMTVAITDNFGGLQKILSETGGQLGGLPNTTLAHCGGRGDRQSTLRDLGRIWMGAYGPSPLLDAHHQKLFHDRMLNDSNSERPLCMVGIEM